MTEQTMKKELPACPVETTLMLIGDKWKVLILRDLMPGTKRFGELRKSIGSVSRKVLTAQLRDMEGSGLVDRTEGTHSFPVTRLTAPGSPLHGRYAALAQVSPCHILHRQAAPHAQCPIPR